MTKSWMSGIPCLRRGVRAEKQIGAGEAAYLLGLSLVLVAALSSFLR
ncbi:hypothetical protein ACFLTZ_06625 [Chloroflexota bacterium]